MNEKQRKAFGNFVLKHRIAAKLTQTAAAQLAGLSRSHWMRIESGTTGTRANTVPMIAAAIKADLDVTYQHAGFLPPIAAVGSNGFERSDFYKLFKKHERLPEPQKRLFQPVLDMITRELDHRLRLVQ